MGYQASTAAQRVQNLKVSDIIRLNKVAQYIRDNPRARVIPKLKEPLAVIAFADASLADIDGEEKHQGGRVLGIISDPPDRTVFTKE